jgi:hypothetical protein
MLPLTARTTPSQCGLQFCQPYGDAGVTFSVEPLELRLGVDDPGGAILVHAVAGIWGLLAVGFMIHNEELPIMPCQEETRQQLIQVFNAPVPPIPTAIASCPSNASDMGAGGGTPEASSRVSMKGLKDTLTKAGLHC